MIVSSLLRSVRRPFVAVLLTVVGACLPALAQDDEDKVRIYVHLETPGRLAYAGDQNQVTIFFKNEGKRNWTNPGIEIEAGFQVYDIAGKKLKKKGAPETVKETQPGILEPNGYFGKIIDLNTMFPDMVRIGSYRITWSGHELPEQSIITRVIKKYDPEREYQAVIETEFGTIVLDFYRDLAPLHVKNFIDLANQGFYDGKLFHRIIKGEALFGGSPTGDERGSPGYNLPAEPNGLKILPGTVAQVRNAATGSNESGSIFMIAAVAQPNLDNRFTVFARVIEGLETVKAMSNLPTIAGAAGVASRPIKDVAMKKVEIREKKTKRS